MIDFKPGAPKPAKTATLKFFQAEVAAGRLPVTGAKSVGSGEILIYTSLDFNVYMRDSAALRKTLNSVNVEIY